MTGDDRRLRAWIRRGETVHETLTGLARLPGSGDEPGASVPPGTAPGLADETDTWLARFLADVRFTGWSDDMAVTAWDILRRDSQQHTRGYDFTALPRPPGPDPEPSPGHVEAARARVLAGMAREWPLRTGTPHISCAAAGAPVIATCPPGDDNALARDLHQIPGCRRNPHAAQIIAFPFASLPDVADAARRHGVDIPATVSELAALAATGPARPRPGTRTLRARHPAPARKPARRMPAPPPRRTGQRLAPPSLRRRTPLRQ